MVPVIAALALAAEAPLLRDLPSGPSGAPASPPIRREPPGGVPSLMPIYGVSTDGQGVTVRLHPDGCSTMKSDFTVAISKTAERPTILFARRSRANSLVACAAQPPSVAISWSYDDLGLKAGQPFSLANPLVMAP